MKTVKPFARQGHYTVFDNALLDHVMPGLTHTAWKVLCFIIRKTIGWQKTEDALAYSQLLEGTGLGSKHTVKRALSELEDEGLIVITKTEKKWSSYRYRLNLGYEISISAPSAPDISAPSAPEPSAPSAPTKEKKERTKGENGSAPDDDGEKPILELAEYFGQITGKPLPDNWHSKYAQDKWLKWLVYIYRQHGSDFRETKRAMYAAVEYANENGLVLATPYSIRNLATAGKQDHSGYRDENGDIVVSTR